MKIYANKFNDHLKQSLRPVYVVTGEEPFQVNECCDALRKKARKEGYTERTVYSVDIDATGHQEFLQSADNMSLFAERKIIEVRLPKGKTGKEWGAALNNYLSKTNDDTLLIVSGHKLDRGVASSAWYKKADKAGVVVTVWPKNTQEMVSWVNQKMRAYKLSASRTAIELIVVRVEGNMLAAEQEIQKLALLFPETEIGEGEVISSVANSSRYSVFDLANAALDGNPKRAARILKGLQGEGVALVLIHWALTQEIRSLSTIAQLQLNGVAPDAAIGKLRIARNKIASVKNALHRHSEKDWISMLANTARLDRMIKGRESGDIWNELQELALFIAGKKLALT